MEQKKEIRIMLEKELQNDILLNFGAHDDIRLWRVNVGLAVGYSQFQQIRELVNRLHTMIAHGAQGNAEKLSWQLSQLVEKATPTKYGTNGTADINGIVSYQRPDGSFFARFIGIEAKIKPNKPTVDQINWGAMVEKRGGIYILAYELKDVRNRLKLEGFDV